jgi:hypothetical protein
MKLLRPKLNPLAAFGATVVLALACLTALVVGASASFLRPGLFSIGIWLLLPLSSAAFYLWASANESASLGQRYFQVAAATFIAPLAAASLFMFLWFVVLERPM